MLTIVYLNVLIEHNVLNSPKYLHYYSIIIFIVVHDLSSNGFLSLVDVIL